MADVVFVPKIAIQISLTLSLSHKGRGYFFLLFPPLTVYDSLRRIKGGCLYHETAFRSAS